VDVALNWLWQGLAIALAATVTVALIPATRPRDRYRVLWAALASVALLPLVPLLQPPGALASGSLVVDAPRTALVSLPARWWASDAFAFALWTAWIAVAAARALPAVGALRRAAGASRPLTDADQRRLRCWAAAQTRGRAARLAVSPAVPSAAVLAGAPPVIAIAPALLEALPADDVDRVVMHEWAHVQRRDDLSLLAELGVRVALGWHPAVWWLDRQLHREREAACDELAVAATGSARAYAACLARVAELRTPALRPLPAVGALAESGLRDRVGRILSPRRAVSAWRRAGLHAASLIPCAIALAIGGVSAIDAATVVADVAAIEARALAVTSAALHTVHTDQEAVRPTPRPAEQTAATVSSAAAPATQMAAPGPPLTPPAAENAAPAARDAAPQPLAATAISPTIDTSLRPPVSAAPAGLSSPPEPTLWGAAADGGTAVGRGSQKAAVATAGFFTRVSKKLAGSF
jgi:beta-lactamase regulating signal transducer with metallopeptidase domain